MGQTYANSRVFKFLKRSRIGLECVCNNAFENCFAVLFFTLLIVVVVREVVESQVQVQV